MLMRFNLIELIISFKVLKHLICNGMAVFSGHPAEAVKIYTHIINGHYFCETEFFTKLKVFDAATWSYMHYAGTFVCGNILPSNDFMVNTALGGNIREACFIMIAYKLRSLKRTKHFDFIVAEMTYCILSENQSFFIAFNLYFNIINFGIDCKRNIRRKRPWSCCPNKHFGRYFFNREFKIYRIVRHHFV